MKLAVISPEAHDAREISVLHALFAAGLERYHLRKPNWSVGELESWLSNFSPPERGCIVLHSHPSLVERWGLAGGHERDAQRKEESPRPLGWSVRSRACHQLDALQAALGRYDAVLLSPIFQSISKPGYGPGAGLERAQIKRLLENRTPEQRRTQVFALGGIDEMTTAECFRLGFDGVAVLGAVWNANDPVQAFKRLFERCGTLGSAAGRSTMPSVMSRTLHERGLGFARHPIMCLTQDGLALTHLEQATRLCTAGARWIQLRMKNPDRENWLATARSLAALCHAHGAIFIINDSVDVALDSGADGVHLGSLDLDWTEAREKLGPNRLLGGTINNSDDVARARMSGCLDYAGVGPWRFTSNKKNLAPVLGEPGVRALMAELGAIPAWVIGGIEVADLPAVWGAGGAGVAVSSALYLQNNVEDNFRTLQAAWPIHFDPAVLSLSLASERGNGGPSNDLGLAPSLTRAMRLPPSRGMPISPAPHRPSLV